MGEGETSKLILYPSLEINEFHNDSTESKLPSGWNCNKALLSTVVRGKHILKKLNFHNQVKEIC